MGITGATNEYRTINFRRIGVDGIKIDIGKNKRPGMFGVITLNQDHRCRNKGVKENKNIARDQRFSSISSRDSSNKDNLRFRNLKVNSRDNLKSSNHNTLSLKGNLKEGRQNIKTRMTNILKELPSKISVG
jgi:hypothetical protein